MLRERVLQKLGDEIRTDYNLAMKEETDIAIPTNEKFPMKTIFFLPLANSLNETQWKTNLENFVSTAMENAFVRNYHTVAFPAIGCGMFGCSVKIVAETLVKTAHEHGNKRKISVIFVIEPTRTDVYEEFQNQVALINPPLNNLFVTIENSNIEIINGDLTTENVNFPILYLNRHEFSVSRYRSMLLLQVQHQKYFFKRYFKQRVTKPQRHFDKYYLRIQKLHYFLFRLENYLVTLFSFINGNRMKMKIYFEIRSSILLVLLFNMLLLMIINQLEFQPLVVESWLILSILSLKR